MIEPNEYDELRRQADEMREALQAAAQRFREYEASHNEQAEKASGWEQLKRWEKAHRNREMAELCEKAMGL